MQLFRLQSLDGLSLLELISSDDINNQPHYKFQVEDKRLQKLEDITSMLFTEAAV